MVAQGTFPISSIVPTCSTVPQTINLPSLDPCLSFKQPGRNLCEHKAQLSWLGYTRDRQPETGQTQPCSFPEEFSIPPGGLETTLKVSPPALCAVLLADVTGAGSSWCHGSASLVPPKTLLQVLPLPTDRQFAQLAKSRGRVAGSWLRAESRHQK